MKIKTVCASQTACELNRTQKDKGRAQMSSQPPPSLEHKRQGRFGDKNWKCQMRYIFHTKLRKKFKVTKKKRDTFLHPYARCENVFFLVGRGNMNRKSYKARTV